jgi:hypothetical protein
VATIGAWRRGALGMMAFVAAVAGCGQSGDTTAGGTQLPAATAPPSTAGSTTTTKAAGATGGTGGTVRWENLDAGQCVASWSGGGNITTVQVVDCTAPHAAEVFWTGPVDTAGGALRGADAAAEGRCRAAFPDYTDADPDGGPFRISWLTAAPPKPGESPGLPGRSRSLMVCVLVPADGSPTSGSARR